MSLSTAYANIGKANRKKDDYDMRTKVISGAMEEGATLLASTSNYLEDVKIANEEYTAGYDLAKEKGYDVGERQKISKFHKPAKFWGSGEEKEQFNKNVESFRTLGRFSQSAEGLMYDGDMVSVWNRNIGKLDKFKPLSKSPTQDLKFKPKSFSNENEKGFGIGSFGFQRNLKLNELNDSEGENKGRTSAINKQQSGNPYQDEKEASFKGYNPQPFFSGEPLWAFGNRVNINKRYKMAEEQGLSPYELFDDMDDYKQ